MIIVLTQTVVITCKYCQFSCGLHSIVGRIEEKAAAWFCALLVRLLIFHSHVGTYDLTAVKIKLSSSPFILAALT